MGPSNNLLGSIPAVVTPMECQPRSPNRYGRWTEAKTRSTITGAAPR